MYAFSHILRHDSWKKLYANRKHQKTASHRDAPQLAKLEYFLTRFYKSILIINWIRNQGTNCI